MKTLLRAMVFGACEQWWSIAFALAGLLHRPRVQWWSPLNHGRVCVIAPHPDDECAGCGGTIVRHQRAGDHVTILQVTDGRGARARRSEPEANAQTRAREAHAAAAALGACLEQLALPEYEWSEAELCAELQRRLARINPDVVYAPSCIDFHPEHLRVARALASVAICLPAAAMIISEAVPGAQQGSALGSNQSLQVGAEASSGLAGGGLAAISTSVPLGVMAVLALAASRLLFREP